MVGPTKLKPRFFRSLLSARDSAVSAAGRPPWPSRGAPFDESPQVSVEAPVLALHVEEGARVGHGRLDLGAVADDAGVGEKSLAVAGRVARDLLGVEAVERLPVALAPAQDGGPAQSRLRALQDQQLEELALLVERHPPLLVVVRDVRLDARPDAAAWHAWVTPPSGAATPERVRRSARSRTVTAPTARGATRESAAARS